MKKVTYEKHLAFKLAKLSKEAYFEKEAKNRVCESVRKILDGVLVDLQFFIQKEDDNIIISFKGSKEWQDIITDLNLKKCKIPNTNVEAHGGFVNSLKLFLENVQKSDVEVDGIKIKDILKELQNEDCNLKLFITGHSLGGAIATLLVAYLDSLNISKDRFVAYTFGSPPVGWDEFYKTYKDLPVVRIVNEFDFVPKLNATKLQHIGVLKELESSNYEHHKMDHYEKNLKKEHSIFLKRKKRRKMGNFIKKHIWKFIGVGLFLTTMFFGTVGYLNMKYSLDDAFFGAFDFLFFNSEVKNNLNTQLEIARISSTLFIVLAFIKTVWFFVYDSKIKPFIVSRFYKDHIVFFGFNGHVAKLIEDIHKKDKNKKVVVVTNNPQGFENIKAKFISYPKELTFSFMDTLSLSDATKIVCLDTKDDTDVKNATAIVEYFKYNKTNNKPKLYIHIYSLLLSELFDTTKELEVKVFNIYDNTIRLLFRQNSMEKYLNNNTTHWLITGNWNQKISMMRYIAQIAYYEDEALPSITLVCNNTQTALKKIRQEFPKIEKTIKLNIVDSVLAHIEQPVTHIGVVYENDVKGLKEALSICDIFKDTPIFLQQRKHSMPVGKDITLFGAFEQIDTQEIIFDEVLDKRAKNIHNYYVKLYGMQPWEELNLFKKNSNRMQAEHIDIKLRGIGWSNNNFDGYDKFLDENPNLVSKWTKVEHLRWNAFHYVNGWDYAPTRDDEQKLHNCLVEFEKLSKKEQDKDEPALRNIPVFVKG